MGEVGGQHHLDFSRVWYVPCSWQTHWTSGWFTPRKGQKAREWEVTRLPPGAGQGGYSPWSKCGSSKRKMTWSSIKWGTPKAKVCEEWPMICNCFEIMTIPSIMSSFLKVPVCEVSFLICLLFMFPSSCPLISNICAQVQCQHFTDHCLSLRSTNFLLESNVRMKQEAWDGQARALLEV